VPAAESAPAPAPASAPPAARPTPPPLPPVGTTTPPAPPREYDDTEQAVGLTHGQQSTNEEDHEDDLWKQIDFGPPPDKGGDTGCPASEPAAPARAGPCWRGGLGLFSGLPLFTTPRREP